MKWTLNLKYYGSWALTSVGAYKFLIKISKTKIYFLFRTSLLQVKCKRFLCTFSSSFKGNPTILWLCLFAPLLNCISQLLCLYRPIKKLMSLLLSCLFCLAPFACIASTPPPQLVFAQRQLLLKFLKDGRLVYTP